MAVDSENIRIGKLERSDIGKLLRLYEAAFPVEERRPYADEEQFAAFMRDNGLSALAVKGEAGSFLGFLTYWTFPGFIYVEHFAIADDMRGMGLGSRMLSWLKGNVSPCVLLEVELPLTEEARQRVAFYERAGFRMHSATRYLQPPYAGGLPAVEMALMTAGLDKLPDTNALRAFQMAVYGNTTL